MHCSYQIDTGFHVTKISYHVLKLSFCSLSRDSSLFIIKSWPFSSSYFHDIHTLVPLFYTWCHYLVLFYLNLLRCCYKALLLNYIVLMQQIANVVLCFWLVLYAVHTYRAMLFLSVIFRIY